MDKNVSGVDLDELKKAREALDRERGVETDPNLYNNYNPNREQQLENSGEENSSNVSDGANLNAENETEKYRSPNSGNFYELNINRDVGQSEQNLSKLGAFSAFEVKDENSLESTSAGETPKETQDDKIDERLEQINDSNNLESMLNDLLNDLDKEDENDVDSNEKDVKDTFEKIPEDEMYHREFNTSIDIEPKFDNVAEDEMNETSQASEEPTGVDDDTQADDEQNDDVVTETQEIAEEESQPISTLENEAEDNSDIITDFSQLKEILQTELKESEDAEKARIAKIEEQKQAESSKYPAIEDFKFINEITTDAFKSTDKFSYILGKNESGETVFGNFKEHFNLAVFGKNTQAVNSLLNSMILSLSLKNSYHDINFVLLDSNIDSAFDVYNKSSYLYFNRIAKTNKEIGDTLVSIAREVDERYDKLAKLGVKSIEEYNEMAVSGKIPTMPYVFIVFNNYTSAAQATDSDKINTCLYQILKFGRNAGMYCVVTATLPIETNQVNYNLSSRISFKSDYDSRFTVGEKGAEDLPDERDALYLNIANGKVIHIKTALVEDNELDLIIKDLED